MQLAIHLLFTSLQLSFKFFFLRAELAHLNITIKSLRIRAATEASMHDLSSTTIKTLGDWK